MCDERVLALIASSSHVQTRVCGAAKRGGTSGTVAYFAPLTDPQGRLRSLSQRNLASKVPEECLCVMSCHVPSRSFSPCAETSVLQGQPRLCLRRHRCQAEVHLRRNAPHPGHHGSLRDPSGAPAAKELPIDSSSDSNSESLGHLELTDGKRGAVCAVAVAESSAEGLCLVRSCSNV